MFRARLEVRLALRPGRPQRDQLERGLTVVELTVAMFVAAILLAGVATVFGGMLLATRTVNTKTATGADLRLAMEAMSRTLKVAVHPPGEAAAFTSFTSTGMSFYALLNRTGSTSASEPSPTLVTYSYAANCLTETQTPGVPKVNPPAGGPYFDWTGAASSTCLLRSTTPPAFTYYAASAGSTVASAATGIRSVLVNLTATDPNNPGISGVPGETQISLENLINADGSS